MKRLFSSKSSIGIPLYCMLLVSIAHAEGDQTPSSPIAVPRDAVTIPGSPTAISAVKIADTPVTISIVQLPDDCEQKAENGQLCILEKPIEDGIAVRSRELQTALSTIQAHCQPTPNNPYSYELSYVHDTTKDIPLLTCKHPKDETKPLPGKTTELIWLDETKPHTKEMAYVESEDNWHSQLAQEEQDFINEFGEQIFVSEQENGDISIVTETFPGF